MMISSFPSFESISWARDLPRVMQVRQNLLNIIIVRILSDGQTHHWRFLRHSLSPCYLQKSTHIGAVLLPPSTSEMIFDEFNWYMPFFKGGVSDIHLFLASRVEVLRRLWTFFRKPMEFTSHWDWLSQMQDAHKMRRGSSLTIFMCSQVGLECFLQKGICNPNSSTHFCAHSSPFYTYKIN